MKENTMEICKMMVMSSGHVSERTAALLALPGKVNVPVFPKADYGWFIFVSAWENYKEELPDDLKACLKLAEDNDCDWLCLDRDGEQYPNLPYYN